MRNIIYKNVVIDPSPELVAHITIAPTNFNSFEGEHETYDFLGDICPSGYHAIIEEKGRSAISHSLSALGVQKDDLVTILTTSGNYYVSGCVTKEIEKFCRWNRQICSSTKVIMVIHEFGYAYKDLEVLKSFNLPIIEDCAHSFFTTAYHKGTIGDFVIYSLPKAFNIQMGAVLASKQEMVSNVSEDTSTWVKKKISKQFLNRSEIVSKRQMNYHYLAGRLKEIGITPFFSLEDKIIPGAFLFRWYNHIDYAALKVFLNNNGVESSVFYGEHAYFIPCHHLLSNAELDYMCCLLEYYYKYVINY